MEYDIVRSKRKTIGIYIKPGGRVEVRAPMRASKRDINEAVSKNADWIKAALKREAEKESIPKLTDEELRELSRQAMADFPKRIERFAPLLGVSCGRITIRCQKTKWGSCSSKGNININCLLMLCPESVRDYVAVHELCHILVFNHSKRFWENVERILPDYKTAKSWLKENGGSIMAKAF